jgi:GTP pyrophosphokinase
MTYYRPADVPPTLMAIMAMLPDEDGRRLEVVFQFAAAAHAGQHRDEGTPFIDHPVAVASILWGELGCRDVDVLVAALTHDVLEDCPELPRDVVAGIIGARADELVWHVTKQPVAAGDRAQRDRAYLDALHRAAPDVRLLKLADRIHNLRSILLSPDRDKARRYLQVSRDEFYPLALATDPAAARLVEDACNAIEAHLARG